VCQAVWGSPSLTNFCEICQALRGGRRAKFRGLLVPQAALFNIGLNADSAELIKVKRVKCLSQHQCGIGAAGFGGTPQQKSRRGEIAILEKITAAADARGDLIGAEWRGRGSSSQSRRLRSGHSGLPNLGARHL
jgi:hypothetical protein